MQSFHVDRPASMDKRARLIHQLNKSPVLTQTIQALNEGEPAPLSFAQERLWVMSRLEPENPLYNVAGAMQFNGLLNVDALQQALDEVMRRHQILRSCFVAEHHEAVQRVMPGHSLALFKLDLTNAPSGAADEFIRLPFDLAGEPPLRGMLAAVGPRQYRLLLVMHHIASDRWSVGILMKEAAALYQAYSNGEPSGLPELPMQYRDFSAWQRQQRDKWAQNLDYWKNKLEAAPPLLELPTDRVRPPVQSYHGDTYTFSLPATLAAEIKRLGRFYHASLFMVIATAFNILLHRYTGSRDITIGYPSAGRTHSRLSDLIGFFVNTLVLRCRLHGHPSFVSLLAQIRAQALGDQAHQEFALGHLLEMLNLPRNSGHSPLFQVMLAVQNVPVGHFQLPGLDITPVAVKTGTAPFDLSLLIEEDDDCLSATFEYSTALFDAETITRMAGHLETLLASICRHPDRPVGFLELLTREERRCLLDAWNPPGNASLGRPETEAHDLLIHQLFSAQAHAAADKTALVCGAETLCYGELDRRSSLLADCLRAQGVGPESRVGVSAERSLELIIGLLAVLKAGGAYVPLDPDYPEERLAHIVNDAGIACLLAQQGPADKFKTCGSKIIYLDSFEFSRDGNSTGCLAAPVVAPDNTAYIIYTSGSTGKPKGVPVSHRNLLHSSRARFKYYPDQPDCFLLLSSFAFDSSVAGIFWTLSQGGCLCLPQKHELTQPFALAQLVHRRKVSHLLALPSFYAALINDRALPLLTSLKTVIVAGEACAMEIAAEHHRKLPAVKFYNEYGPTEATVWSSVWQSKPVETGATLSIGRPIADTQIYILDTHYQPAPVGIAGELLIGGNGLTHGYLNQAGLTAEKFVPHPFSATGRRLYKTGDLGRYRADGTIEFLGRIDNQVKIRGYRIELDEIASRLLQYPSIAAAAVLVRADKPGRQTLTAYFVAAEAITVPDTRELQDYLGRSLPSYMLPSVFIRLERLPLTPNGKLDRNALPEPGGSVEAKALKRPGNAVEQALANIWQEVLGIDEIDIGSRFFDLGGHSLAAIRILSRIQEQFDVELPASRLFEAATIELLALEINPLQQYDANVLGALLDELEQMSEQEAKDLLDA